MSTINQEAVEAHEEALELMGELYEVDGHTVTAIPGESTLTETPDVAGFQRMSQVTITLLRADLPLPDGSGPQDRLSGKTAMRVSDSRTYRIGEVIEDVPGILTLELHDPTTR